MKRIGNLQNILLGIIAGIAFISCATAAHSQEINVAAVVSPRHIQLNEKAKLELTISGNTFIKHIDVPTFNFLPAFLAVPVRASTTPRLIENKIAVSMAWAYELIPQKVGDFALSDIRFSYQGTPYFANPGTIRVTGTDTYVDVSTGGIHKVEAVVDTPNPYHNAAVTYTFRYLYTTVLPTRDSPTPSLPAFPGFLVEELPSMPTQTKQRRGKMFRVQEFARRLYPQKTGRIVIEPASLTLPLPRGRKTLRTAPLTLTIQPLPEIGKPPQFTGAVGEYQISAQTARGKVAAGSALTLSIRISGRGNMQTVTAPKMPPLSGVIVNGPNRGEGATPESHVYAYALLPARVGTLQIPAIEYVYFNPRRGTYETTQTTPIPITVLPNPNDIGDSEPDNTAWRAWILLLGLLFVGLATGGYLWYRTRSRAAVGTGPVIEKRVSSVAAGEAPTSSTAETVISDLKTLEDSNTTENATAFGNALAQTLYQYFDATFAISQRNIASVRAVCTQAGVSEPILQELVDILTKCDYHRFAPVPLSAAERKALIARAEAIIHHIEHLQNT